MLEILDRLAGWWLDWRTDREAKNNPLVQELGIKKIEATPGGWEGTFVTPAVAIIADEMAGMLDNANAKNYVVFDFMPRLDRGKHPVRVTVQWAQGQSPAQKATMLEEELKRVMAWHTPAKELYRVLRTIRPGLGVAINSDTLLGASALAVIDDALKTAEDAGIAEV